MGKQWLLVVAWVGVVGCGSGLKVPQTDGAVMDKDAVVVPVGDGAIPVDASGDGQAVDGLVSTDGPPTSIADAPALVDGKADAFDPLGLCAGSYVACGCGCCGPSPGSGAEQRCYYPTEGDRLSSIMADDLAIRGGPSCATVGCTLGTVYQCCVPTAAATPASYSVETYFGGYDRLMIQRVGYDGQCATLLLESPSREPNPAFRVTTPPLFRMVSWSFGACGSTPLAQGMGGVGAVSLRKNGTECVLDVQASLFLPSSSGPASSVRFEATGIAVPGFSASYCGG